MLTVILRGSCVGIATLVAAFFVGLPITAYFLTKNATRDGWDLVTVGLPVTLREFTDGKAGHPRTHLDAVWIRWPSSERASLRPDSPYSVSDFCFHRPSSVRTR
jgi:hypothetical protein